MTHIMKLNASVFQKIANNSKTIELRLNDEKRQKLKCGDWILFQNSETPEIITATIDKLYKFRSFEELYENLPLHQCGYTASELATANPEDMLAYYSRDQMEKYGALGIALTDTAAYVDVKLKLLQENILHLLSPSVFNPTKERLKNRAQSFQHDPETKAYAYCKNGRYSGIIIFKSQETMATVLDIAVDPAYRDCGIGSGLIDFIFRQFKVSRIFAETDDDAVGFYKNYGFTVNEMETKYNTKRYFCICENTIF